jgi:thioredoxin-dependent peroxiredoxin
MSKKTRKKSPRPSVAKTPRAHSAKSAGTPPSKARGAVTDKTVKKAKSRQTPNATSKGSHKPPSKPLKSRPAAKSPPRIKATGSKTSDRPSGDRAGAPAASRPALAEGASASAFQLPRDGGTTVSLADYAGKKLVLFFYPRADTPGCTREAIDFTRLATAFAQIQTSVLGVSADPPKTQESFRDKHGLGIPLVSDERHEMLRAYGPWGKKSMYGRTFEGILRTTVLIGVDGRIARIWRNVRVDGHAEDVLAAAQAT